MATDFNSPELVAKLAAELASTTKDYTGLRDTKTRYAIRDAAKRILAATQDPEEQWVEYLINIAEMGAVKLFDHLHAFEKIPREGSIAIGKLAEQLGADRKLWERLVNILVAVNVLSLEGDQISHTPLSRVYLDKNPGGLMAVVIYDEMNVPCSKWPEFFDKHGLKETGSMFELTPHSFSWGQPDKNVWDIIHEDPRRTDRFIHGMQLLEHTQPCLGMYDFSWVADYAQNGEDKERKLIVDIGGGRGYTLQSIINESPGITAKRCVLQDRADVIEAVEQLQEPVVKDVGKQVIDFFKEQPVKGALIYYLRRCLHDWSDDFDVQILSHIAKSCAPDSKVLMTEQLLATPPIPAQAAMDICMLNIGGTERTEERFREMADRAGLKVIGVFKDKQTPVAVIECALK